jgi:hypothetical protein
MHVPTTLLSLKTSNTSMQDMYVKQVVVTYP